PEPRPDLLQSELQEPAGTTRLQGSSSIGSTKGENGGAESDQFSIPNSQFSSEGNRRICAFPSDENWELRIENSSDSVTPFSPFLPFAGNSPPQQKKPATGSRLKRHS